MQPTLGTPVRNGSGLDDYLFLLANTCDWRERLARVWRAFDSYFKGRPVAAASLRLTAQPFRGLGASTLPKKLARFVGNEQVLLWIRSSDRRRDRAENIAMQVADAIRLATRAQLGSAMGFLICVLGRTDKFVHAKDGGLLSAYALAVLGLSRELETVSEGIPHWGRASRAAIKRLERLRVLLGSSPVAPGETIDLAEETRDLVKGLGAARAVRRAKSM